MIHTTARDIINKKKHHEKITMLTAYDYPLAKILDQAGIDIILVGDSLANVVLGLSLTTEIGMPEMIHHAKAVCRGVQNALVVGDMPFDAYQVNIKESVVNAKRFVDEAGCGAVKIEWFDHALEVIRLVVDSGIPVMGHVGLTPQTASALGGFKVQGKDAQSAKAIIDQAKAMEQAGCFSVVLECIPDRIAQYITNELSIPTLGIGAGIFCDGQVLVAHDILGLYDRFQPKFVKRYADLGMAIREAVQKYKLDVKSERFPQKEHSFTISEEEFKRLR